MHKLHRTLRSMRIINQGQTWWSWNWKVQARLTGNKIDTYCESPWRSGKVKCSLVRSNHPVYEKDWGKAVSYLFKIRLCCLAHLDVSRSITHRVWLRFLTSVIIPRATHYIHCLLLRVQLRSTWKSRRGNSTSVGKLSEVSVKLADEFSKRS